jgi:hypothetical protein
MKLEIIESLNPTIYKQKLRKYLAAHKNYKNQLQFSTTSYKGSIMYTAFIVSTPK